MGAKNPSIVPYPQHVEAPQAKLIKLISHLSWHCYFVIVERLVCFKIPESCAGGSFDSQQLQPSLIRWPWDPDPETTRAGKCPLTTRGVKENPPGPKKTKIQDHRTSEPRMRNLGLYKSPVRWRSITNWISVHWLWMSSVGQVLLYVILCTLFSN